MDTSTTCPGRRIIDRRGNPVGTAIGENGVGTGKTVCPMGMSQCVRAQCLVFQRIIRPVHGILAEENLMERFVSHFGIIYPVPPVIQDSHVFFLGKVGKGAPVVQGLSLCKFIGKIVLAELLPAEISKPRHAFPVLEASVNILDKVFGGKLFRIRNRMDNSMILPGDFGESDVHERVICVKQINGIYFVTITFIGSGQGTAVIAEMAQQEFGGGLIVGFSFVMSVDLPEFREKRIFGDWAAARQDGRQQ